MTDLTDRMRTCAAFILGRPHEADTQEDMLLKDAAELLVEAAHLIDMTPEPLGEPMATIEPITPPPQVTRYSTPFPPPLVAPEPGGFWIDEAMGTLPPGPKSRNACPQCDSRTSKTVKIRDNHVWLICPVCGHQWKR